MVYRCPLSGWSGSVYLLELKYLSCIVWQNLWKRIVCRAVSKTTNRVISGGKGGKVKVDSGSVQVESRWWRWRLLWTLRDRVTLSLERNQNGWRLQDWQGGNWVQCVGKDWLLDNSHQTGVSGSTSASTQYISLLRTGLRPPFCCNPNASANSTP